MDKGKIPPPSFQLGLARPPRPSRCARPSRSWTPFPPSPAAHLAGAPRGPPGAPRAQSRGGPATTPSRLSLLWAGRLASAAQLGAAARPSHPLASPRAQRADAYAAAAGPGGARLSSPTPKNHLPALLYPRRAISLSLLSTTLSSPGIAASSSPVVSPSTSSSPAPAFFFLALARPPPSPSRSPRPWRAA
jgi:hypothetical protein